MNAKNEDSSDGTDEKIITNTINLAKEMLLVFVHEVSGRGADLITAVRLITAVHQRELN